MRVRHKGTEYELSVNPCPWFGDGPFLGVDLASMTDVIQFIGGRPSPPDAPLPEIYFHFKDSFDLLFIRDERSKVEPIEMRSIRRMPNVLSRDGWLILPVNEWLYSPDLADLLRPRAKVIEFPQVKKTGHEPVGPKVTPPRIRL